MDFHVSLVGRRHLGREIYRQLRAAILDGRLRAGDALPPTREMARRLAVARATVTGVYERLAAEGYVASRVGSGTYVSEHAPRAEPPARPRRRGGALAPRPMWSDIAVTTTFAREAAFDFRTGLPDASLFPRDAWRRLMAEAFNTPAVATGVYADPAGHPPLREAIARHIGVSRGVACTAADITITNGTQQALDVVARVLLAPGDRVAVEDPGYRPARLCFQSLGLRIAGVPVDGDGLVVDAIPRGTRLIYVTPSHQYPLGVAMSLQRRTALLEWAERHGAAIVEDDYDSEFRIGGRPIEPIQTLDCTGRVIYVGSFSKTMLPILRLGFVLTPPSLRDAVRRAKYVADWHTSLPAQVALARFIDDGGFARHLRKVGSAYRARHAQIVETLGRDFAEHLQVVPSWAGLHVTAMARRSSAAAIATIARRAMNRGVAVQQLAQFAVGDARDVRGRAGLVLGYGAITESRIDDGLRRLRDSFGRDT